LRFPRRGGKNAVMANDPVVEKPRPQQGNWPEDRKRFLRLIRYMKPYRGRVVTGLVAGAFFGVIAGAFPKAVEFVFKSLFEGGQKPSLWMVIATCLAVPIYYAIRGVLGFLNHYCLAWVSSRMLRDLRVEAFSSLQRLPMDFFVHTRHARLIQIVQYSTRSIQVSIVKLATDIVKQPVTIIVAIVVLGSINLLFCLYALVLGALCLIPMTIIGRKVRNAGRDEEKSADATIGVLHESLSNVRVIKAYLLEKLQIGKFRDAAQRQMNIQMRFQRRRDTLSPLVEWIGSLGTAGALLFVYFTDMPFSEFMAVMAGFYLLYDPLKRIGNVHVTSQRVLVAAERVFELIDREPQAEPPDAHRLEGFEGEIRFEDVSLTYARRRSALDGVSLTIPRGMTCAMVGPSGSGKTSMVNLLLGFYKSTAGRVTIDGHDLTKVSIVSLRQLISLVTQETLLFPDTVANNISYGRLGASREEIVEAARKGHAHEFIMALPKQYDTVLGERGQNLSGGQCQRLAIARAILRDPAILVLDEATSALDAESEQQVQEAMNELMRDRTVLMIAHRLSSIKHADLFVVLDKGRIVEQGNHDELIRRDGLYRRLYDLQVV